MELADIIKACREQDRLSQKALYDKYARIFLGICMRYLKRKEDAEDAMIIAFHTIFSKISTYTGTGSFEGWMKRIVVNTCLMELRRRQLKFEMLDPSVNHQAIDIDQITSLYAADILKMLDQVPEGQRTVFNLFAIEGYKHKEIAELLGVSINTSKSQLIQARKKLVKLIDDGASEKNRHESIN